MVYGEIQGNSIIGMNATKDDTIIISGMPLRESIIFAFGMVEGETPKDITMEDLENLKMNEDNNFVREIDRNGNIIWELTGFLFPHDVEKLKNGNIIVADTFNNRILELDEDELNGGNLDDAIVWEWEAHDIDWEKVNADWDEDHFYNDKNGAYAHPNDFDFYEYDDWTGMLISLRNYNIVIELNYTAEKEDPESADNIVWYYGDYDNTNKLYHQHDPEYMENGNILIADSENSRIVEIDYDTKKKKWEYNKDLGWCREADELASGNILIGDDDKVIIVDYDTKEIIWEYSFRITMLYEVNILDNKHLLILSNDGLIVEVNYNTKMIVWIYGFRTINWLVTINCIIVIIFLTFSMLNSKIKYLHLILIAFLIILIINYPAIMNIIGQSRHQ